MATRHQDLMEETKQERLAKLARSGEQKSAVSRSTHMQLWLSAMLMRAARSLQRSARAGRTLRMQ
jgi:hypothetical protein